VHHDEGEQCNEQQSDESHSESPEDVAFHEWNTLLFHEINTVDDCLIAYTFSMDFSMTFVDFSLFFLILARLPAIGFSHSKRTI